MKFLIHFIFIIFLGSAYAQNRLPPCSGTDVTAWSDCYGTAIGDKGDRYQGEFKNGRRDGQGTNNLVDGSKYEGGYLKGLRSGYGIFTAINGDKYIGSHLLGQRTGQGTYIFADGGKYIGEWKDGKNNGQGTRTWPSGSQYVGEFLNNERHGQGTFIFPDGRKYIGDFKHSKLAGLGTLYAVNSTIINQGFWENSKFIRTVQVDQNIAPHTDLPKISQNDRVDNEVEKQLFMAQEAKRKQDELEQKLRVPQNQTSVNTSRDNQSPSAIQQGRRFALVIGNASYSSVPQLTNAINDAREITRALQLTGFEVTKFENADLRQMQNAVRDFGNKLGNNDVGLFYFAGHGVQVKGKNYLIPVRENIKKSFEVPSSALDADLILANMENAKNNLNIMILDACRSPFPGEARSLNRGLATLDAAKGTLIAYATAPGKEALDGQGNNSPYTRNLVRALGQKGLSIEQVFKQVRIAVVEETKGAQVPWENSSIMGDFYFRK